MKSILYVFIRSYDTSYIRRNSKNKRICAAEHDTSTPTNDVNQDTKKHERLPTIEYLIIEVLIFHSGLLCLFLEKRKFIILTSDRVLPSTKSIITAQPSTRFKELTKSKRRKGNQ
jgi:hypothetical protein